MRMPERPRRDEVDTANERGLNIKGLISLHIGSCNIWCCFVFYDKE